MENACNGIYNDANQSEFATTSPTPSSYFVQPAPFLYASGPMPFSYPPMQVAPYPGYVFQQFMPAHYYPSYPCTYPPAPPYPTVPTIIGNVAVTASSAPQLKKIQKHPLSTNAIDHMLASTPGKHIPLPESCSTWMQEHLLASHRKALENPSSLLQDFHGLKLTRNVDFGVKQILPSDEPALTATKVSSTSSSSLSLTTGSRSISSPSAPSLIDRTSCKELSVMNTGSATVLLLDVRLVPPHSHCMYLKDEAGVTQSARSGTRQCVRLRPGESHSVTLLLHLDPAKFKSSADAGLLSSFVLFTCLLEKENAPVDFDGGEPVDAAIVLSRRVTAALVNRASELEVMLRAEAPPFIPKKLRQLFSQPPSKFWWSKPILKLMWGYVQESSSAFVGGKCQFACQQQDWAQKRLPGQPVTRLSPQDVKRRLQPLDLAEVLVQEELAMERDVEGYRIYNTRVRTAVIGVNVPESAVGKATGAHLPKAGYLSLLDWPPQLSTDDKGRKLHVRLSSQPDKAYRGPKVPPLLMETDPELYALHLKGLPPILGAIDVPGLLEGRPPVVVGDVVYIRLVSGDQEEFACQVAHTDGSLCLMLMPHMWWRQLWELQNARKEVKGGELEPAPLVHVCFTFDRTGLCRMHHALKRARALYSFLMPWEPQTPRPLSLPEPVATKKAYTLPERIDLDDENHFPPLVSAKSSPEKAAAKADFGKKVADVAASMTLRGSTPLNLEQRHAVAAVVCGAGKSTPFLLFGPPGTGKTVTLVELVLQLLRANASRRVLLCAPTNFSADLLASALSVAGVSADEMLRLNDPRRPIVQAKADTLPYCLVNENLHMFALPAPTRLLSARVVIASCAAAGMLREGPYLKHHETRFGAPIEFDYVLMDEACQALGPEALIPLTLLRTGTGATVLCGDPHQLGPVVRSASAVAAGLGVSLMERLTLWYQEQAKSSEAKKVKSDTVEFVMLVRNYRSHRRLLDLPSRLFYGDRLRPFADPSSVAPPAWEAMGLTLQAASISTPGGGSSLLLEQQEALSIDPLNCFFYGVKGKQAAEFESRAYFNPIEASAVVDLIESLLQSNVGTRFDKRQLVTAKDIGVICTYRKQVIKLRLLLRERGLGSVRVGTVDDYQGQEERIVFISTVLSSPETLRQSRRYHTAVGNNANGISISNGQGGEVREDEEEESPPEASAGFWANPKRFNVAITRARALLVVVGHPLVLAQDPHWCELLRHCVARDAFRGAGGKTLARLLRGGAQTTSSAAPWATLFPLQDVTPSNPNPQTPDSAGGDVSQRGVVEDESQVEGDGTEEGWVAVQEEEELAEWEDDEGEEDLQEVVNQLAERTLVGYGDIDRLYPETYEEGMIEQDNEELPWRVVL